MLAAMFTCIRADTTVKVTDVSAAATEVDDIVVGDADGQTVSRHEVTIDSPNVHARVVVSANGGATTVHEHSAVVVDDVMLVAVCGHVVALQLSDLRVRWTCRVDAATCFGLHAVRRHDELVLISHGELEIARFTLDGRVVWSAGGPDIFTGDFGIVDDTIAAVDFNGNVITLSLLTGTNR